MLVDLKRLYLLLQNKSKQAHSNDKTELFSASGVYRVHKPVNSVFLFNAGAPGPMGGGEETGSLFSVPNLSPTPH